MAVMTSTTDTTFMAIGSATMMGTVGGGDGPGAAGVVGVVGEFPTTTGRLTTTGRRGRCRTTHHTTVCHIPRKYQCFHTGSLLVSSSAVTDGEFTRCSAPSRPGAKSARADAGRLATAEVSCRCFLFGTAVWKCLSPNMPNNRITELLGSHILAEKFVFKADAVQLPLAVP